ncbi:hypothetical protein QVD17_02572 [Tagetes erecta]|uniref:Myb-like domain-containing protein n=1 Tax=Tagetes erecta TaxID=13708 RepID=A0AAD8P8Z3_TARER|nr:hypothetical protein QVD17_02572 [Tagetes erecta]
MDAPRRSTSRGGSQKRSGRGRGTGLSRGSGSSDPPPYFPQMHQQQPQFPMMQSAPGHQFNYSLQDDWSFDPFGARFNTPQPRDQYSQGSRANYIDYNDYNDYNDYEAEENQDVVPETQQFQNIHVDDDDDDDQEENLAGERAKKVQKFAGRAERQIWTPNQEENLAKAWVHISVDKKVGNQQPRDGFWKRVLKHYATLEGGSTRTHHQLNSKWTSLNTKLAAFNSTYINAHIEMISSEKHKSVGSSTIRSACQRSISPSGRFCSSTISSSSSSSGFTSSMSNFSSKRSTSPNRISVRRSYVSSSPSVRFTLDHRHTSPNRSNNMNVKMNYDPNNNNNINKGNKVWSHGSKKTCLCSPTTHPGSFRCSLHKNSNSRNGNGDHDNTVSYRNHRLHARRSAMTNSLVRIGTVEGDLVKRALAALIRPSSHQQRRRCDFKPRPSRLSVMSKADD